MRDEDHDHSLRLLSFINTDFTGSQRTVPAFSPLSCKLLGSTLSLPTQHDTQQREIHFSIHIHCNVDQHHPQPPGDLGHGDGRGRGGEDGEEGRER